MLKGSSKEILDLTFVICTLYIAGTRPKFTSVILVKYAFVVLIIFGVFLMQQLSRAGIEPEEESFGLILDFAFDYVCRYLSQGYYGLSLVLFSDSGFHFIIGHIDILNAQFTSMGIFSNSDGLVDILDGMGWDKGQKWSSMYASLVYGFGWTGTIVFMIYVGFIMGASVKSLRKSDNIIATLALLTTTYIVMFSSMNFQIGLTLHFTLIYLLVFTLFPVTLRYQRT